MSEYIITTGLIHVQKCCPGSVTGVAWYGWARNWYKRGPGFDSAGNRAPFWGVSFKWDRLEREYSDKVLGLTQAYDITYRCVLHIYAAALMLSPHEFLCNADCSFKYFFFFPSFQLPPRQTRNSHALCVWLTVYFP